MSILNSLKTAGIGKVLAVYASASFVLLQAIDLFRDNLELPPWIFGGALVLLIVGLPIVVATAVVQQHDFKSQLIEKNFTWRRAIGGGVVAFTILLVAGGFYARDRFGGNDDLDANLVAVFPFRVSGAEQSLHYLAEGMVDLLGAKLSGDAGVRAADARSSLAAFKRIKTADPDTAELVRAARSIGARRMILGAIVGNSDQLTITASVTDTRTGRTVTHFVAGPAADLPSRVDELAAALLSLDAREPRDRMATLTSTSLPAVRAFLLAEEKYRQADYNDAVAHYTTALNADSSFALAALGIIVAQGWGARMAPGLPLRVRRLAWRNRDRLSEVDRLKLYGYVGDKWPQPMPEIEKCKVWQQILQREPERVEALHERADCVYHYWKVMGLENDDVARTTFAKAIAFDSSYLPSAQHLLPMAAARRDVAETRRLSQRFFAGDTSSVAASTLWYVAYAEGKSTAQLLDSAMLPPNGIFQLAEFANEHSDDVALTDSLYSLFMARNARTRDDARPAPNFVAMQGMRRGRTSQMQRAFELMNDGGKSTVGTQWAITSALYADNDSIDGERSVRALKKHVAADTTPGIVERCVIAQWQLWKQEPADTDVLARYASAPVDTLDPGHAGRRASARSCLVVVNAIRATMHNSPDARAHALRVDSLAAAHPQWFMRQYHHIIAARLLELNNEPALARTAVRRAPVSMAWNAFEPSALLQHARLSAKLGDRDQAIRDYRRFLATRTRADGRGARMNEEAKRELSALTGER